MGGTLLCWTLLCGIRRWIRQSRYFRSVKWDTVNILLANIPYLVLLLLYWRHPRSPASLLPSLSYASLIIPHLFFQCLASLPDIFCCCLNLPESPQPYTFPYLYLVTSIFHVLLHCTCQPDSPQPFSSYIISIITHIFFWHTCCPASLILLSPYSRIYAADVSIIPRIYWLFGHQYPYLFLYSYFFLIAICLRLCCIYHLVSLLLMYLLSYLYDSDASIVPHLYH